MGLCLTGWLASPPLQGWRSESRPPHHHSPSTPHPSCSKSQWFVGRYDGEWAGGQAGGECVCVRLPGLIYECVKSQPPAGAHRLSKINSSSGRDYYRSVRSAQPWLETTPPSRDGLSLNLFPCPFHSFAFISLSPSFSLSPTLSLSLLLYRQ